MSDDLTLSVIRQAIDEMVARVGTCPAVDGWGDWKCVLWVGHVGDDHLDPSGAWWNQTPEHLSRTTRS